MNNIMIQGGMLIVAAMVYAGVICGFAWLSDHLKSKKDEE